MARPRRGVRVPLLERAPGIAGRRRGTGDADMMGIGLADCDGRETPPSEGLETFVAESTRVSYVMSRDKQQMPP